MDGMGHVAQDLRHRASPERTYARGGTVLGRFLPRYRRSSHAVIAGFVMIPSDRVDAGTNPPQFQGRNR